MAHGNSVVWPRLDALLASRSDAEGPTVAHAAHPDSHWSVFTTALHSTVLKLSGAVPASDFESVCTRVRDDADGALRAMVGAAGAADDEWTASGYVSALVAYRHSVDPPFCTTATDTPARPAAVCEVLEWLAWELVDFVRNSPSVPAPTGAIRHAPRDFSPLASPAQSPAMSPHMHALLEKDMPTDERFTGSNPNLVNSLWQRCYDHQRMDTHCYPEDWFDDVNATRRPTQEDVQPTQEHVTDLVQTFRSTFDVDSRPLPCSSQRVPMHACSYPDRARAGAKSLGIVRILQRSDLLELKIFCKVPRHPNIVLPIMYQRAHDGYFVMVPRAGGSLADVLAGNDARVLKGLPPRTPTLPLAFANDVVRQVWAAVKHLREHNIAHNDIKPSNILVFDGHDVKLTDFEFATALDANRARGYTRGFVRKSDAPPCERDLYALGVTWLQLLVGACDDGCALARLALLRWWRCEHSDPSVAKDATQAYNDAADVISMLLTFTYYGDGRAKAVKAVDWYVERWCDDHGRKFLFRYVPSAVGLHAATAVSRILTAAGVPAHSDELKLRLRHRDAVLLLWRRLSGATDLGAFLRDLVTGRKCGPCPVAFGVNDVRGVASCFQCDEAARSLALAVLLTAVFEHVRDAQKQLRTATLLDLARATVRDAGRVAGRPGGPDVDAGLHVLLLLDVSTMLAISLRNAPSKLKPGGPGTAARDRKGAAVGSLVCVAVQASASAATTTSAGRTPFASVIQPLAHGIGRTAATDLELRRLRDFSSFACGWGSGTCWSDALSNVCSVDVGPFTRRMMGWVDQHRKKLMTEPALLDTHKKSALPDSGERSYALRLDKLLMASSHTHSRGEFFEHLARVVNDLEDGGGDACFDRYEIARVSAADALRECRRLRDHPSRTTVGFFSTLGCIPNTSGLPITHDDIQKALARPGSSSPARHALAWQEPTLQTELDDGIVLMRDSQPQEFDWSVAAAAAGNGNTSVANDSPLWEIFRATGALHVDPTRRVRLSEPTDIGPCDRTAWPMLTYRVTRRCTTASEAQPVGTCDACWADAGERLAVVLRVGVAAGHPLCWHAAADALPDDAAKAAVTAAWRSFAQRGDADGLRALASHRLTANPGLVLTDAASPDVADVLLAGAAAPTPQQVCDVLGDAATAAARRSAVAEHLLSKHFASKPPLDAHDTVELVRTALGAAAETAVFEAVAARSGGGLADNDRRELIAAAVNHTRSDVLHIVLGLGGPSPFVDVASLLHGVDCAAAKRDAAALKMLLAALSGHGMGLDHITERLSAALHSAVQWRDPAGTVDNAAPCATQLIDAGARPHLATDDTFTAAVAAGDLSVLAACVHSLPGREEWSQPLQQKLECALRLAAENDSQQAVDLLIAAGVTVTDAMLQNSALLAKRVGDAAASGWMPRPSSQPPQDGWSTLCLFADRGGVAAIESLVKKGHDPNFQPPRPPADAGIHVPHRRSYNTAPPLHLAARTDRSDVIAVLCHFGADPLLRDLTTTHTALDVAAQHGAARAVRTLLRVLRCDTAPTADAIRAVQASLMHAVEGFPPDLSGDDTSNAFTSLLVTAMRPADAIDLATTRDAVAAALMHAVRLGGRTHHVTLIMEQVHASWRESRELFKRWVSSLAARIVDAAAECECDVEAECPHEESVKCVVAALKAQIDRERLSEYHVRDPVAAAAAKLKSTVMLGVFAQRFGCVGVAATDAAAGPGGATGDADGWLDLRASGESEPPLLVHARCSKEPVVRWLVDHGACDHVECATALTEAIIHGNDAVAKLLLQTRPHLATRAGPRDATPLMLALEHDRTRVAAELLMTAAERPHDDVDADGSSALHYAANFARPAAMQRLLDVHGHDAALRLERVMLKDKNHRTPLYHCVRPTTATSDERRRAAECRRLLLPLLCAEGDPKTLEARQKRIARATSHAIAIGDADFLADVLTHARGTLDPNAAVPFKAGCKDSPHTLLQLAVTSAHDPAYACLSVLLDCASVELPCPDLEQAAMGSPAAVAHPAAAGRLRALIAQARVKRDRIHLVDGARFADECNDDAAGSGDQAPAIALEDGQDVSALHAICADVVPQGPQPP